MITHSLPNPFFTLIELTYRCNFRCMHCHVSAGPSSQDEMTLDEAIQVVDEMADAGVTHITLTGGEALLKGETVFKVAEHITNIGLRPALLSNGFLLTKEVARKLKDSGIRFVGVSLPCASGEAYDSFVGGIRNAYESAILAIRNCVDVGIPLVSILTIGGTEYFSQQMPDLVKLALGLGVNKLEEERLVSLGRGSDGLEELRLSKEVNKKMLQYLHQERKQHESRIRIISSDPLWRLVDPDGPFIDSDPNNKRMIPWCTAAWTATVTPNLQVKPCAILKVTTGDLRKQSFKEIWQNSELFVKIRNKENLKGKCGRCEFRHICGGCRATAYAFTGDYLAEDPMCWHIPHGSKFAGGEKHGD